ncbi:MAG: VOC family protein [Halapricum sp.]
MIRDVDHIEILASDAEEMVTFLKILGFEEIRQTEHHDQSYELAPQDGDTIFEIHTVQDDETPGINHIAFSADEIEEVTEDLQEAGIDQVEGPFHFEPTDRTLTNFRDPDGRRFQLVGKNAEDSE